MCDFSPCAEACRLQNLLFVCSRRDEHSSGQIPGPRADGRRIVPLKRRSVTDCGRIVGNSSLTRVMEELPITQEKSRNSPELLCNLAFGIWTLWLPQFDRISLRVMQASEPAVGIRLRVNLDRDSRALYWARNFADSRHPKFRHPNILGS